MPASKSDKAPQQNRGENCSAKKRNKDYSKWLRTLREKRGMSLRALATLVGVHPTYLSKIELGQTPPPHWTKKLDIAVALVDKGALDQVLDQILEEVDDIQKHTIVDLAQDLARSVTTMKRLARGEADFRCRMVLTLQEALNELEKDADIPTTELQKNLFSILVFGVSPLGKADEEPRSRESDREAG
jgi:transcriptional regulator with XRE-family HTH domain